MPHAGDITRGTLFDIKLRKEFPAFARWAFEELHPGQQLELNWHHKAIFHQLDRIWLSELDRLIVSIGPRSLKSFIISVAYPAWLLGRKPDCKVMCVSYGETLSDDLAEKCRRIMQMPRYRSVFPDTELKSVALSHFTTTAGGYRLSAPFGGGLTGHGADIILLDDPIKASDAKSEVARANVLAFYRETIVTRLNDPTKGAIVLVMQRLHSEDLAGTLIEAGGWELLSLPAVAPEDIAIQIGKKRVHQWKRGFLLDAKRLSAATLKRLRHELGSRDFSAQYLCAPLPDKGAIIKRAWLKYYEATLERQPGDLIVQSWDCANSDSDTSDFSAGLTVLVRDGVVYVIEAVRERLTFPALKARVEEEARRYQPDLLLIEDAAAGQQLVQVFASEAPSGFPPVVAIKPRGDKESRVARAGLEIERSRLLLPRGAPFLPLFEREILHFPNVPFDDQVDALAQALIFISERSLVSNIVPIVLSRVSPWLSSAGGEGEEMPSRILTKSTTTTKTRATMVLAAGLNSSPGDDRRIGYRSQLLASSCIATGTARKLMRRTSRA